MSRVWAMSSSSGGWVCCGCPVTSTCQPCMTASPVPTFRIEITIYTTPSATSRVAAHFSPGSRPRLRTSVQQSYDPTPSILAGEQAFRLQGRHAPRLGVLLGAAELEGDHDL